MPSKCTSCRISVVFRRIASVVMRRYRSGGTPWTVIIDRDGVVRYNDFSVQPTRAISLIDRLLTAKKADQATPSDTAP